MTSSPGGPRATISSASVRLAAPLVGLAAVLAGKALIACRLRRPPEGWRRTLGLLLRSEPTRFALSAFGLRVPEAPGGGRAGVEERTASGLQAFLATQADAHFRLEWRDGITIRRRVPRVDVVLLRFAAGGKLEGLTPCLAPTPRTGAPTGRRASPTTLSSRATTGRGICRKSTDRPPFRGTSNAPVRPRAPPPRTRAGCCRPAASRSNQSTRPTPRSDFVPRSSARGAISASAF